MPTTTIILPGLRWGAAENYDLILNTSRMDLEKIVDVIEKYVSLT